jgi:hypothetical protein
MFEEKRYTKFHEKRRKWKDDMFASKRLTILSGLALTNMEWLKLGMV